MRLFYKLSALLLIFLVVSACRQNWQRNGSGGHDNAEGAISPNAACYVCHMTFVEEELTVTHQQAGIGCIKCHGLSAAHANDEDVGATPPDKVVKGEKINPFCRDCHKDLDDQHEKAMAQKLKRKNSRPNMASVKQKPICTQCHGQHQISNN